MSRHKRHHGAPLGNQNARKHGFYSSQLSPQESLKFWNTVNIQGVDPRVLALRLKIASAFQNAPGNTRLLLESSRLLSKLVLARQSLNRKEYTAVKKIFRDVVKTIAAGDHKLTEQLISESLAKAEKLQNK